MNFLFIPSACIPFHNNSLEERPLGGTETAVIRLAQSLSKLGHKVRVLSAIDNPPLSEPLYVPLSAFPHIDSVDVLIAVREWRPLFLELKAAKRLLWTGDSYDQLHSVGLGDKRVYDRIDALLAVSEWHANSLSQHSGFPREKARVIRNGVHLEYFEGEEARHRKRLIYTSTPYRGLQFLPQIFQALKQKHKEAELHVFSGYGVYAQNGNPVPPGYDRAVKEFEVLKKTLLAIEGIYLHENVTQQQLSREFMKSSVLAYPNIFEETSCISALEAQAAGCAVVTSRLAALPETVANAGILVDGKPGTESYQQDFVAAIDRIWSDPKRWEAFSQQALKQAQENSWDKVAQRLLGFL